MTSLLIQQVLIMFILVSVGYICFRTGKITMEGCRSMSNILIYLSLPCVIIHSFLVEFTMEKWMGFLYSAVATVLIVLISMVVSRAFFSKDCILNFASSFSNPGFFGIPLIVASLNEGAVFYVTAFIAFVNLMMWSYGVLLLTQDNTSPKQKGSWKQYIPSPKRFFTAPFMIATLIGVFFFLTGIPMPKLIGKGIQYISGVNTPLAMFTMGIYLAQTDLVMMFKKTRLYLLSIVRLFLIPVLSMLVLAIFPKELAEMKLALLLVAACPTGTNIAVYAQLYDSDYSYAVETVIISTLWSIVSIPLIVQIAEVIQLF